MIQFIEDNHASYAHRTKENAKLADVTLAFAVDFTTSGERLTEESARKHKKGYYAINIKETDKVNDFLEKYGPEMRQYNSFNIAGNGLARLHEHKLTQQYCDEVILYVLRKLINDFKVEITEIRSGGQSGADESGLKAALTLDIDAICLFPRCWRFNNGIEEIESEPLFKKRFINKL